MNKKAILTNAIKMMIQEELKHYDKLQNKHTQKEQKPEKVEKERMATEEKVDDKKQKFIEAVTHFVNEYNTKHWCDCENEELVEELMEVGKIIGAKKAVVEKNVENYGKRPKIYAFEVASMFRAEDEQGISADGEDVEKEELTKSEIKKVDPERAPEPKTIGKEHPDAHWKVKEDAKKSAMGTKNESAPKKPKGVKEMPTKAKTAKGVKLMGKHSK